MNDRRDDAKRLRILDAILGDELSQLGREPSQGMPSMVVQTKTISAYPKSAQSFFACSPLTVLGQEVEGGSGTTSTGASTFYVLNLGSAVPPVGVNLLATFVDNRWVFRYDG